VYPGQARTEGIEGITPEDAAYADKLDCNIKLLGRARRLPDGRAAAMVAPMLVPREGNLLACVSGVNNAILVRGDAVGDVIFYGRGAGPEPTASAVVADIIDCARHIDRRRWFEWEDGAPDYVAPAEDDIAKFYMRVSCDDTADARKQVLQAFPGASFIDIDGAKPGELAFVTIPVRDGAMREALAALPGIKAEMVMRVAGV